MRKLLKPNTVLNLANGLKTLLQDLLLCALINILARFQKLLSQGYIRLRLEKSFKKFYGRYQDLIEKYQRSVNVMVNDSFPG